MSIFKFANSAGVSYEVQGPPGATYDQARVIFNQQYSTGGLTGLPVGGILNAVTQTQGGLATAPAEIGQQAIDLVDQNSGTSKLPVQIGKPPATAITVSEFVNTGVNSQTIGDVSTAQVQGLVATTAAVVDQSANVITTTKGLGTYGLTADQLQLAGLIKPGIADQVKQDPANAVSILSSPTSWTGLQGATDINTILADAGLQTATQQDLMSNSYEQLKQNGTLNGNESAEAVGPLVNAATKYGVEPTTQWLNNNAPANTGTQISNFVNSSNYGSNFGANNKSLSGAIGALSLGVVIAKGYTNTVNRQNLNQATAAVIGNPKIPTPNFPSAGSSTVSNAAATSSVNSAIAVLSSVGSPAQVVAALNTEIVKSGGQALNIGYGGILRTADGAAVTDSTGRPITIGGDSSTLGSGITSADKAAMFSGGGIGIGVSGSGPVTGTGVAGVGSSISNSVSKAFQSLQNTYSQNPTAVNTAITTAIASAVFGPFGPIVARILSAAINAAPPVAPAVDQTAAEDSKLAQLEASIVAAESAAEASPVPSSDEKSQDAAQFGGNDPPSNDNGSYSNSLTQAGNDPSGSMA